MKSGFLTFSKTPARALTATRAKEINRRLVAIVVKLTNEF
jgi:hypothetical protein